MNYMEITAKNYEDFAMYHSKTSNFNVCDQTPFGRDIIGDFLKDGPNIVLFLWEWLKRKTWADTMRQSLIVER